MPLHMHITRHYINLLPAISLAYFRPLLYFNLKFRFIYSSFVKTMLFIMLLCAQVLLLQTCNCQKKGTDRKATHNWFKVYIYPKRTSLLHWYICPKITGYIRHIIVHLFLFDIDLSAVRKCLPFMPVSL